MAKTPQPAHATPWRGRLHEIIFEADTPAGKAFDVSLLWLIVASVVTVMLSSVGEIEARAEDWQVGQFYPASCSDCGDQPGDDSTAIIKWRLDNDSTIREAFYETDGDLTNRFFLDLLADQAGFRDLIVTKHGELNAAHPDRYKQFIVSGDVSHTALQSPLFYSQDANGVFLNQWAEDFLVPKPMWIDIVEYPAP